MLSQRNADLGLLILRLGIGLYFMAYGLAKLFAGSERWTTVGGAMGKLGIDQWPAFWGFSVGLVELCGGALLALGLLFRPSCGLLAFVMLIASITKAADAESFFGGFLAMGHPAMMLIVFVACCFIGPGAYALDRKYRMTLTRSFQQNRG